MTNQNIPAPQQKPTVQQLQQTIASLETRLSQLEHPSLPKAADIKPSDYVSLASLNEDLLSKEHSLCHYRMTWTLTSQAILFVTFFTILANKNNIGDLYKQMTILILMISLVSMIVEILGIHCAVKMMRVFEQERTRYIKLLNSIYTRDPNFKPIPDTGVERVGPIRNTNRLSEATYYAIPFLLIVAWAFLLLSRFGVLFNPF